MYRKLKGLRNKYNISCRGMSIKLNISASFYCQIENMQRKLTYDMAVKISKIFESYPDELFYDEFVNKKYNENR